MRLAVEILDPKSVGRFTPASAAPKAGRARCRKSQKKIRDLAAETASVRITVGRRPQAPLPDGAGQCIHQDARFFPTHASIGDALAINERLSGKQVLPAFFQMAF